MCTLIIHRRPGHDWPVLFAANRDEMADRPWFAPKRHWPDRPEIIGGLDEIGGGSWLALNEQGVVAAVLNRVGSLGPASGKRSRGELVLDALDYPDATEAAEALAALDTRAYRPFNLIIADNRDAWCLTHDDPTGKKPVTVTPLNDGLNMVTAEGLDAPESLRIRRYRKQFAAALPNPEAEDWQGWQDLLASSEASPPNQPETAMCYALVSGFGTRCAMLLALPAIARLGTPPIFQFTPGPPDRTPWQRVTLE